MDFVNYVFVVCACLATLLRTIQCQSGTDAKNLRKQLFITDGYDYKIRPINNQANPTEVYLNLHLLSINGLDEVQQTLKTTAYLSVTWTDDFLKWNPSSYGGITYYYYPQDDVWKPDVALKNSNVDYKKLGVSTLNVVVNSTGNVQWSPFQIFQPTCSMNIARFPFDVQTCELKFVAWSYLKEEVDMRIGEKGIVLTEYESNSEWDISDWRVAEESDDSSVIFTLTLKRKPLYALLSIVMPIFMLAILNIFVFVLPCDSGEKASYAMTVFLTFAVYLTIVSTTLPKNSDSVAIFSAYVIIQTVQSTIITLVSLIMIRCNTFSEDEPVPKCLILLTRLVMCMPCRQRAANRKVKVHVVREALKPRNDNETSGAPVEHAKDVKDSANTNTTLYTWKIVINALDRIYFCLFSIILVTSTVVCFILAITSAS